MKSHALLRTNVGLTTNAKIIVGASYSLYVDSIISNTELSSTKYKKLEFNKSNYWDEILPYFFKNTPAEIAYFIKDDGDNKNMSKDFSRQYDDLYQYGARNIIENKDYVEEFEYFAPLYVSKTSLPKKFVIFRIDGSGLNRLDRTNFSEEVKDKLKCVKIFDLTRNTPLGEWLETNITKNKNFPSQALYIDFRKLEFSSWVGIDYEDGGFSERSVMFESTLQTEQTYTDLEKTIIDGYKNNKIVYPYILNFSFLFDDTPATPTSIRTWSLNRYLGFYLDDLEFVKNVSPYILPKIKSDVVIDSNNLIFSVSDASPFEETFKKEDNPYIEIGGQFYKIERFLEQQPLIVSRVQVARNTFVEQPNQTFVTKYKIISNISLAGRQDEINKNIILIESTNEENKLTFSDGTNFSIDGFDEADVWLIEIDGLFHNIIQKSDGHFYINTDYAFSQSLEKFEYYINDPDTSYRKTINLKVDNTTFPKQFAIYKCKFTDIKDFDTDIIDTEYSKFEYLFRNKLSQTDETKMYSVNLNSNTSPKDIDDFKINGNVVNIPVSSEYLVNSETFRIENNDLYLLWKKNSKRVKWGFQNSISSNDYPYLLNNSFSSEDFNRTANPYNPDPDRQERNLDYFLTINSDSDEYLHQTLHVLDRDVITFENLGSSSNFLKLIGVSNIGQFKSGDFIEIIVDSEDYSIYNDVTKISSINFQNNQYSIITQIVLSTPISGTVSGRIVNKTRTSFSLDRYLNIGYENDYFNYFFSKKTEFDNGVVLKNTQKFSEFNTGDNSIPNLTLFRGLKFKVFDVANVKVQDDIIESINIKSNNNYDDYKFSILLSNNNFSINSDPNVTNGATLSYSENLMKWQVIDEWKHDKIYQQGDIVIWNDVLYTSTTQSQIVDPSILPFNSTDWAPYSEKSIFWSYTVDGTSDTTNNNVLELGKKIFSDDLTIIPPLVFNFGEYYYSTGAVGNNFWNPNLVYDENDVVLYQDNIWISTVDNNRKRPADKEYYVINGQYRQFWEKTTDHETIWKKVEIWNPQRQYSVSNSNWGSAFTPGHYVIYEDIVYVSTSNTSNVIPPSLDDNWKRLYSLVQDTNFEYYKDFSENYNPIIKMNNRYYLCRDNGEITFVLRGGPSSVEIGNLSTLENGINIYVNKKWKNILINIYVNDNTYCKIQDLGFDNIANTKDTLSNTKRDDIYTDLYTKLSANNFMNAINDLSNYYEFSDKVRYIIIEEDLSLKLYDFNDLNTVENLPVLITCEGPDEFLVKINSLKMEPVTLSESQFKVKRRLSNGEISTPQELNYYSDNALGVKISSTINNITKVPNYSGLSNNVYNNLFRHSGPYAPIFKNIELFEASTLTYSGGNYKFDTSLTNFGNVKERVVSKINRQKNILKLRNNPETLSIYPMIDEFGYHTISFYIFKSTWDFEYHVECREVPDRVVVTGNQSLQFPIINNNTNNNNLNLL